MPFKFTDYVLTPRDFFRGIYYFIRNSARRDVFVTVFFAALFVLMKFYFDWDLSSSLLVIFGFFSFYLNVESRIPVAFALLFLALSPILFILGEKAIMLDGDIWADQTARWAFYFLAIAAMKQAWDFKTGRGEETRGTEEKIEQKAAVAMEYLEKEIRRAESEYVLDLRKIVEDRRLKEY